MPSRSRCCRVVLRIVLPKRETPSRVVWTWMTSFVVAGGLGGFEPALAQTVYKHQVVSDRFDQDAMSHFEDGSELNATTPGAVSAGQQWFTDGSVLNAKAANAVSGGAQHFQDSSTLNAKAANAVSGGLQAFRNYSILNAEVANAVTGGQQSFFDFSVLNATAANAVSGGFQTFYGTSMLNATAASAVNGGSQVFRGYNQLNARAAYAISGGYQEFWTESQLNAEVANAVAGGSREFFELSAVYAASAAAISGGAITLHDRAAVMVMATDALTNAVSVTFFNGGELNLNGFSTTIGHIAGNGIIQNYSDRIAGQGGDAVLTVDTSRLGDSTFGGVMGDGVGTGKFGLAKDGAGTLTLTGDNTYTGMTTVKGGRLVVDGSIAGSFLTNILPGAWLEGRGIVGTTQVAGTIATAPGAGLTVKGDYTQLAGSFYRVNATATGYGLLTVAGRAVIQPGATLDVADGYPPSRKYYRVLGAGGGIDGAYTTVRMLDPDPGHRLVIADWIKDTHSIFLYDAAGKRYVDDAWTRNQRATARVLDDLPPNDPLSLAAALLTDAAAARRAYDQLSGEMYASTRSALIEDSHIVRDAANDRLRAAFASVGSASASTRLAYASADDPATVVAGNGKAPLRDTGASDRYAIWGQDFGGFGRTSSDGNAAGISRSFGGFLVGVDTALDADVSNWSLPAWRLGALAGYGHTSFRVPDRSSSGSSDNTHFGLYAGTQWGALAFRSAAAYTWHTVSIGRAVVLPELADNPASSSHSATAQAFGELGYRLKVWTVDLEPFGNLAYVNFASGAFAEKGGVTALHGLADSSSVTFTTLGLRAATDLAVGGVGVTLSDTLGWRHAFGDTTPFATLALGGIPFAVAGVPIARDALVAGAGLRIAVTGSAALDISYDGQFADSSVAQSFRGHFTVRF